MLHIHTHNTSFPIKATVSCSFKTYVFFFFTKYFEKSKISIRDTACNSNYTHVGGLKSTRACSLCVCIMSLYMKSLIIKPGNFSYWCANWWSPLLILQAMFLPMSSINAFRLNLVSPLNVLGGRRKQEKAEKTHVENVWNSMEKLNRAQDQTRTVGTVLLFF